MGNCIIHESSMQWGGEDWGSPAPDDYEDAEEQPFFPTKRRRDHDNDVVQLNNNQAATSTSSSTTTTATTETTEVKIKVTRKQLEKLVGKVDLKELSVQQVLTQLMIIGGEFEAHHGSWRPALQSIPE